MSLQQHLNILRNGSASNKILTIVVLEDGTTRHLPNRDHYERWAEFNKRHFPRKRQYPWANVEVTERAKFAHRDTVLGIIDTITREVITYWIPEIMLLGLAGKQESGDLSKSVGVYKGLAHSIKNQVLDVFERVECTTDRVATQLKTTLRRKTKEQLLKIYETFEDQLSNQEKEELDPRKLTTTKTKSGEAAYAEPISEARILDSSLAWELNDSHGPSQNRGQSTQQSRKRAFSELRYVSGPEPDPTDNGQVWNSPGPDNKRRRVKILVNNVVEQDESEYGNHENKPSLLHNMVDLTRDDYEADDNQIFCIGSYGYDNPTSQVSREDSGGQCTLM